jgi:hypothetical protein
MIHTTKPARTDRKAHTADKRNTAEGIIADVFENVQP